MYLLDTNIISELRKPKPYYPVVSWLKEINDKDLHISAVTLGEIQAGIEITREQDNEKAKQIEQWLCQSRGLITFYRWMESRLECGQN